MPRDHELLVGRNDVNGDPTLRSRYQYFPRCIRSWIEDCAEPCELLRDPRADDRRVLADSRGEHERVEAAKRCCEHSGVKADTQARRLTAHSAPARPHHLDLRRASSTSRRLGGPTGTPLRCRSAQSHFNVMPTSPGMPPGKSMIS